MKRTGRNSSKTTGAETNDTTTLSVAEEVENTSAGDNRACSNRESRKDKCSDSITTAENRVGTMQPICHGDRQGKKLLCLWMSRSSKVDFVHFYSLFFIFIFLFLFFSFSIFRTTWVRGYQSRCHISHNLMA